jgi:AAA domain
MRVEILPSALTTPENLVEINFPRKELVHGLIETPRVYVLSAPIGFGKSNIARHMALSVARGLPFLGFRTHKSRVVWVNGELDSDSVDELDAVTPEGTELVVFDFPSTVINCGYGGSLSEFAERRKLAVFAFSRRPGSHLLNDSKIVHWRASFIDAAGGSYAHGRIETGKFGAIPIVRGNDGDWTLDVYRVKKAFADLGLHRFPKITPIERVPTPPINPFGFSPQMKPPHGFPKT